MNARSHFLVATILLVGACHTERPPITITETTHRDPDVPPPLQPVYATDGDAEACAKLVELGCTEGNPRRGTCIDTFRHARTNEGKGNAGAIDRVSACVASAANVVAVRGCGGQWSLTFECPGR